MSSTAIKNHDRKSQIMAIIQNDLDTKHDVKNSAIETGKTIVSALAGSAVGAFIGKPSLLASLPTIFAGKYFDNSLLSAFGTGMLSSGSYKAVKGMEGTEVSGLEGATERIKAFGKDLKERLYIDKIKNLVSKQKDAPQKSVDGLESVTYFNPNTALDMGSLDDIENEIQRHAEQFQKKQFAGSGDEDLSGGEDDIIY